MMVVKLVTAARGIERKKSGYIMFFTEDLYSRGACYRHGNKIRDNDKGVSNVERNGVATSGLVIWRCDSNCLRLCQSKPKAKCCYQYADSCGNGGDRRAVYFFYYLFDDGH